MTRVAFGTSDGSNYAARCECLLVPLRSLGPIATGTATADAFALAIVERLFLIIAHIDIHFINIDLYIVSSHKRLNGSTVSQWRVV